MMRHTTSADGTPIAYRLRDAAGPRMAMLHPLALDGSVWDRVCDALGGRAATLAVDLRGHGASGKPPGPYRAEDMADDLAAAMADAGWADALVIGCSMGGCVAQAFALRHPARTRALLLMATTAWYGEGAPEAWAGRATKALNEGFTALAPFQAARWFTEGFVASHPKVLAEMRAVFERNNPPAYAASCSMMGAFDLRDRLGGIVAPTTVLVGEDDPATPPAMARLLQAGIPGARLLVVASAKHLLPVEKPAVVAEEAMQA
jgi:3-oxoadipate enol-lactonase